MRHQFSQIKFCLTVLVLNFCLSTYTSSAYAELNIDSNSSQILNSDVEVKKSGLALQTTKKSWLELAPNFEAFEGGIATILISIADYIDFEISTLPSNDPNFALSLKQQNCVTWNQSLKLSAKCLQFLKENHSYTFDHIALDFLAYYDYETPSYEVEILSKEFPVLKDNFVLKRLNSMVDLNAESLNPVTLLNPNVASALWTVPGNDANCFGTAYAAVTPKAPLRYRDYLWANKSPMGYVRSEITDDLVFGDLIEFEIPGDGHATVYLGTDQEGDHIVLTKNGFMPSVVQVMKYEDVYKLYEQFNITKVNVWRPDPNSYLGFATPGTSFEETDFQSLINTRKNSVEVSVDEALAIQRAKGFAQWKNQVR